MPIDFALEMGWWGTAPVYRLESPRPDGPHPTAETINALARVLEMGLADRIVMLGFAGHIPDAEPLSPDEMPGLREWLVTNLDAAAQPMLLIDNRYRILGVNETLRAPFQLDATAMDEARSAELTDLDLLCDPSLGMRDTILNVDAAGDSMLLRFMLDNRLRRHEPWYQAFPASRARLPGFTDAWHRIDALCAGTMNLEQIDLLLGEPVRLRAPDGQTWQFLLWHQAVHVGWGMLSLVVLHPLDEATARVVEGLRRESRPRMVSAGHVHRRRNTP